jgi:hypothetical protein
MRAVWHGDLAAGSPSVCEVSDVGRRLASGWEIVTASFVPLGVLGFALVDLLVVAAGAGLLKLLMVTLKTLLH